MKHELWIEPDNQQTFCLKGPMGDSARSMLAAGAQKVWEVEAASHFEAMTLYYVYMGWGVYKSSFYEHDIKTYVELGWED